MEDFDDRELPIAENKPVTDNDGLCELENLIDDGTKITISRVEPPWAKGMLESIEVGPFFGLDYLIKKWGGSILRIKVRGQRGRIAKQFDVPLRGWPVKMNGKVITEQSIIEGITEDTTKTAPTDNTLSTVQSLISNLTQSQPSPNDGLQGGLTLAQQLMNLLNQQRNNDLQVMGQWNTQPQPMDPIGNFVKMARAFRELQGVFGTAEPAAPAPAADDLLGSITPLLTGLMQMKNGNQAPQSQPQPQNRPMAMPTPVPAPQPIRMPVQPIKPIVMPEPETEPASKNLEINDLVKNKSPKEIADTCKNIFESLGDEERGQVLQEFMGDMTLEEIMGQNEFYDETDDENIE